MNITETMHSALLEAGTTLQPPGRHLSRAMATARTTGIQAHADGVPETVIAEKLGVDRMTVRKWLGKR